MTTGFNTDHYDRPLTYMDLIELSNLLGQTIKQITDVILQVNDNIVTRFNDIKMGMMKLEKQIEELKQNEP